MRAEGWQFNSVSFFTSFLVVCSVGFSKLGYTPKVESAVRNKTLPQYFYVRSFLLLVSTKTEHSFFGYKRVIIVHQARMFRRKITFVILSKQLPGNVAMLPECWAHFQITAILRRFNLRETLTRRLWNLPETIKRKHY